MPGKRKKTEANGKNAPKKTKSADQSKESFLLDVRKLKLYTDDDRYYSTAQTTVGALELDWH